MSYSQSQVYVLKITIVLVLLCSFIGVTFNCALLYAVAAMRNRHFNLKLMLCNVSLSAVMLCSALLFTSLNTLFRWEESCLWGISAQTCALQKVFMMICYCAIVTSTFGIAIDRAVATKRLDRYDSTTKLLGVIVALAGWILPCLAWLGVFFSVYPLKESVRYCGILFLKTAHSAAIVFGVQLAISLATLVIYQVILTINRGKLLSFAANQAQLNLASRIQLRRNIDVTETILMSVKLQFFTSALFDTSLLIFIYFQARLSEFDQFVYSYPLNLLLGLYTVLHPILITTKSEVLMVKFRPLINQLRPRAKDQHRNGLAEPLSFTDRYGKKRAQIKGENFTDIHFEMLTNAWNSEIIDG